MISERNILETLKQPLNRVMLYEIFYNSVYISIKNNQYIGMNLTKDVKNW